MKVEGFEWQALELRGEVPFRSKRQCFQQEAELSRMPLPAKSDVYDPEIVSNLLIKGAIQINRHVCFGYPSSGSSHCFNR